MKYNTVQLEVTLKVKINWLNPPKDKQEEIEREEAQCMLDKVAAKFAEGMEGHLFDAMVIAGAMKSMDEVQKEELL